MNRRSFFRLVAGAGAWIATQHVAWAFPEPIRPIPARYFYGQIKLTASTIADARPGAFVEAMRAEMDALIRDLTRQEDLNILKNRVSY